jgi:two-component system OmpR family response regulator
VKVLSVEHHRKLKKQVLIIHNNENIYCEIRQELESLSTKVVCTSTLNEAVKLFVNNEICLVIMDTALSEDDNRQFLRMMRIAKPVPILLLSSNTEYPNRLRAFQAGANAYLGKLYTLDECIAQAKSLINLYVKLKLKPESESHHPLAFGTNLTIKPIKRLVFLKGQLAELSRKEFNLLFCLANHPGKY